VLGKSGPLVSIPNSNQAKSTADVRGSPARGKQLVDRTVQLENEAADRRICTFSAPDTA
jgi:hypothetical protein